MLVLNKYPGRYLASNGPVRVLRTSRVSMEESTPLTMPTASANGMPREELTEAGAWLCDTPDHMTCYDSERSQGLGKPK